MIHSFTAPVSSAKLALAWGLECRGGDIHVTKIASLAHIDLGGYVVPLNRCTRPLKVALSLPRR